MDRYNFKIVEEKWQKLWDEKKVFSTKVDKSKKKFYCLDTTSCNRAWIEEMLLGLEHTATRSRAHPVTARTTVDVFEWVVTIGALVVFFTQAF